MNIFKSPAGTGSGRFPDFPGIYSEYSEYSGTGSHPWSVIAARYSYLPPDLPPIAGSVAQVHSLAQVSNIIPGQVCTRSRGLRASPGRHVRWPPSAFISRPAGQPGVIKKVAVAPAGRRAGPQHSYDSATRTSSILTSAVHSVVRVQYS